jgi:uncharacterized membrane protein
MIRATGRLPAYQSAAWLGLAVGIAFHVFETVLLTTDGVTSDITPAYLWFTRAIYLIGALIFLVSRTVPALQKALFLATLFVLAAWDAVVLIYPLSIFQVPALLFFLASVVLALTHKEGGGPPQTS